MTSDNSKSQIGLLNLKILKSKFKLQDIWDSIQDSRFETLLFDSPPNELFFLIDLLHEAAPNINIF